MVYKLSSDTENVPSQIVYGYHRVFAEVSHRFLYVAIFFSFGNMKTEGANDMACLLHSLGAADLFLHRSIVVEEVCY